MTRKTLDIVDVVQRTLSSKDKEIVSPLVDYLGIAKDKLKYSDSSTRSDAEIIISYLCRMGSNDIASLFRKGEGVSYDEVVYDVAKKLGVKDASKDNSAEKNENLIIAKAFADAYDKMTAEEKEDLLKSLNIEGTSNEIPFAASGAIVAQILLKKYGGFAVYKISLIVANFVSRALLGKGLTFAVNAALTRGIGAFLGPIGWAVTGVWLAAELAGPAYRKTVPAIIHLAMLRQLVINEINIGIVGAGSVGKDSLFKAVFKIDTENIDPVAGSTSNVEQYHPKGMENITLLNFPGHNDIKDDVNEKVIDQRSRLDIALLVIDISSGVSGDDTKALKELKALNIPTLVCLNKIDLVRPRDKERLLEAARERLKGANSMIQTSFDPDDRLHDGGPIGVQEVFEWVKKKLEEAGKDVSSFEKSILDS